MFSLHENTRIRLCRAGFFALCILPTVAVLAWALSVNLPSYRRTEERAIGAQLGCTARVAKARILRPGERLYEWLELEDRETGQLLARAAFVEVAWAGGKLNIRVPSGVIINGARPDALWKLICAAQSADDHATEIHLEAPHLTLHTAELDQDFTDVRADFGGEQLAWIARLSFRKDLGETSLAEPATLTVARHADGAGGSIELSTGPASLPSRLISALWPGVVHLGEKCSFDGRLTATQRGGQWITQASGRLREVDLQALVDRQFPHRLTGWGDVRLKSLRVIDGRIESITGSIIAGPGFIGRSLVYAASTQLHVQSPPDVLKSSAAALAYQQLAIGFDISSQGLALRGELPETRGGMLSDGRRVLVSEPALGNQDVLGLVRTLVPSNGAHLPGTREAVGLAGSLPLASGEMKEAAQPPEVSPQPATPKRADRRASGARSGSH